MLKLAVKSSLAGGAMYYASNLGVWGSSVQSEKLYNQLKEQACPHVIKLKKKLPFNVPALPESGEVRYLAKHYYNNGVKSTFHHIHMLPCYAGQLVKKTKDTIGKVIGSSPLQK